MIVIDNLQIPFGIIIVISVSENMLGGFFESSSMSFVIIVMFILES